MQTDDNYKRPDITETLKSPRLIWAGHLAGGKAV